MTKIEYTHERDLRFSQWIRRELPDSRRDGLTVFDVDFVLRNYKTERLAFIEVKCKRRRPEIAQRLTMTLLDSIMQLGTPHVGGNWKYVGYWLLQFENTMPDDGRVWIDDYEVTEQELKHCLGHIIHPSDRVAHAENQYTTR
jgi:hypothetical protein